MRMTTCVALVVAAVALMAARPAAQERGVGGVGLTVFEDRNYRGDNATFLRDEPSLGASGLDRRISSLRVGPGEFWEACDQPNFRGRCQVFSGVEADLRRVSWDNRIRSVRRVQGGAGGYPPAYPNQPYPSQPYPPAYPPGGSVAPPGGLLLFSGQSFSGRQQVVTSAIANLRNLGFDNQAQSVRVGGGLWEICEDTNFRKCRTVSGDVASLSMLGLSRRVSSVRPAGGGSGVMPPAVIGQIELFDRAGFQGRSQRFSTAVPSASGLLSGQVESLRIRGGAWQVCDGANFMGSCTVLATDIPDLNQIGWGNRIRSIRPAQ